MQEEDDAAGCTKQDWHTEHRGAGESLLDGNFTSSLGATVLVQWVGLGINLVWRAVEGMPSQHWYWGGIHNNNNKKHSSRSVTLCHRIPGAAHQNTAVRGIGALCP